MATGGYDPTTENETPWEDHGIDRKDFFFFFFVICFICFYYTLHCLQNIGYNICITLITIHTYTYNNFFFFFLHVYIAFNYFTIYIQFL